MSSVAVVILTYNEEPNLDQALRSVVGWAHEIFVLDSYSSDTTIEIAARCGCTVVQHRFEDYAKQRNFALQSLPIKSEWVFFLDADEWVPEELKNEISRLIASLPEENGFYIKRRLIWMGRWIRRGYYPTWILRLFRRGRGRCEDRQVNEHMIVEGKVGYLENDFIHEDRKGITDWISKHNSYATREAQELFRDRYSSGYEEIPVRFWGTQPERKRWIRQKLWLNLPPLFRAFCYFFYRYIFKGGFLDGREAFVYHFFQGLWYTLLIDAKYLEMKTLQQSNVDEGGRAPIDADIAQSRPLRSVSCTNSNGVASWYSHMATHFDSKYGRKPGFIERYNVWTQMIDENSKVDGFVLDVGCGSGVFSFYAAARNKSVVGIDASKEMIKICRRKKLETDLENLSFIESDIHELSSAGVEKADMIICSSVLEYVEDPREMFEILFSLLKEDGVLLLSVPNKSSIYRKLEPIAYKISGRPQYYAYVRHVLTVERTSAILRDCGLRVLRSAYYGKTPVLSRAARLLGLARYFDNMFVLVAKKLDDLSRPQINCGECQRMTTAQ